MRSERGGTRLLHDGGMVAMVVIVVGWIRRRVKRWMRRVIKRNLYKRRDR